MTSPLSSFRGFVFRVFMAFQTEGGGMGCKRLDLTRYWTRLKAAGRDPCAAYGAMMYNVAKLQPGDPPAAIMAAVRAQDKVSIFSVQ